MCVLVQLKYCQWSHEDVNMIGSKIMQGQTKRSEMRRWDPLIPGCDRLWRKSKTWRRKAEGTKGRNCSLLLSPKSFCTLPGISRFSTVSEC